MDRKLTEHIIHRSHNEKYIQLRKVVLIVDVIAHDSKSIATKLDMYEDCNTKITSSAAESLRFVEQQHFDAIIINSILNEIDGHELCRAMRKRGVRVPIFILSDNYSDSDIILGLNSGANDCILKPIKFDVLLARIRSHLNLHKQSEFAFFNIGPYKFCPAERVLIHTQKNIRVTLTDKETSLLKFLYHRGEESADRETILDSVWGYNSETSTHTIETHIYRLRQKIEENPKDAKILVTEDRGYKLYP